MVFMRELARSWTLLVALGACGPAQAVEMDTSSATGTSGAMDASASTGGESNTCPGAAMGEVCKPFYLDKPDPGLDPCSVQYKRLGTCGVS